MTALRAAAAAFKREEQSKQAETGFLRSERKRKRESSELAEYTRVRRPDKVSISLILS